MVQHIEVGVPPLPLWESAPIQAIETVGSPDADAMTREVAAAVHLRSSVASELLRIADSEPHRALYPSSGIDLRAVLGHAGWAQRMRLGRDLCLATLLALAAVGALGGVPIVAMYAPDLLDRYLVIGLAALVAAVLLVVGVTNWYGLRRATRVLREGTEGPADRLWVRPGTATRIRDLARSNVVMFSGDDPFFGAGEQLLYRNHAFGIGRPARNRQGKRKKIRPFTASQLHDHLAATVPSAHSPDLTARNLVLVNGLHAHRIDQLRGQDQFSMPRDALTPPALTVSTSAVTGLVNRPEPGLRSYLCLQRRAWSNQLVTSLFVRAEVVGSTLLLELVATALGPPGRSVRVSPHLPTNRWGALVWTLKRTAADSIDVFISSPRHLAARVAAARDRRRKRITLIRRIRQGLPVDYGARLCVREAVAGPASDYHFMLADERMWFRFVSRRMFDELVAFLRSRGLDTTEFEQHRSEMTINNWGASWKIGTVQGQQNVLGDQTRVHGEWTGQPKPPTPPGNDSDGT